MSADESSKTYVRRRAFSKIHVTSWLIYLEKDGYVRCPFQNCNFMAFNVEEMCNHFGYCKGETSTAKFECEHCKGRTDSLRKLQVHLQQAHNVGSATTKEAKVDPNESDVAGTGKPSKVLIVSWTCFFDKHNYVKCQSCNYIANTLADMCRHYKVCKQELAELLYVCPVCKGRTMNVNPLLWHLEKSHKIFKAPIQFNHIYKAMITFWQKELEENQFACCLHTLSGKRDCCYFDLDLIGIIEHSQCCKGPQFHNGKEQCPCCPKWTNSKEKLNKHIKLSHLNDLPTYKIRPFGGNLDEEFILEKLKSEQSSNLLQTGTNECDQVESPSLPKENKAQEDGQVFGELSRLLPHCSKSNDVSESLVGQFHEVVIPPSLYAIVPDQQNNQLDMDSVDSSKTSVNNHCKSSISDGKIDDVMASSRKESKYLAPTSNGTQKSVSKLQLNPSNNLIKEEISCDWGGKSDEDIAMFLENKYSETIDTKFSVKKDYDIKNQTYLKNEIPSSAFLESSFKNNENYLPIKSQGSCSTHDQIIDLQEKHPNEIAKKALHEDVIDGKRKRASYALFSDDTSDEEDSLELEGGFQIKNKMSSSNDNLMNDSNELNKPTEDGNDRVLSKNYLRRPRTSKSFRCSPLEISSTMTTKDNINLSENIEDDVSRTVSSLVEEVARLGITFSTSKIGVSNLSIESIDKDCVKNDIKLPIKLSKSSEKNDKLLLPTIDSRLETLKKGKCQTSSANHNSGNIQDMDIHYDHIEDDSTCLNSKSNVQLPCDETASSNQNDIITEAVQVPFSSSALVIDSNIKIDVQSLNKNSAKQIQTTIRANPDKNIHKSRLYCSSDELKIKNSKNTLSQHKTTEVLDDQQKTVEESETLEIFHKDNSDITPDEFKVPNYKSACNDDIKYNVRFVHEGKILNKSLLSMLSLNESDEETHKSDVTPSSNEVINKNACSAPQISKGNITNDCVTFLKICCEYGIQNRFQYAISKSESSDLYNESSQDEEFLGTDEEPDMKDKLFSGFQDISDTKSRSRQFKLFLTRLSESESEEWYVNAGNLDMNFRKQEGHSRNKTVVDKSHKCQEIRKYSTNNLVSQCENSEPTSIEQFNKNNVGNAFNSNDVLRPRSISLSLANSSNHRSNDIELESETSISVDKIVGNNICQTDSLQVQINNNHSKTKVILPMKKKRGRPSKIEHLGMEEMEKYVENIKQEVLNTLRIEHKNREDLAVGINNKNTKIEKQYSNFNKIIIEPHYLNKNKAQNMTDDDESRHCITNKCNALPERTGNNCKANQPKILVTDSKLSKYQCQKKSVQSADIGKHGFNNHNEQKSFDTYQKGECSIHSRPLKIITNQLKEERNPINGLDDTFEKSQDEIEDEMSLMKLSEVYKTNLSTQIEHYTPFDENELLISVFSDDAEVVLQNIEKGNSAVKQVDPNEAATNIHILEKPTQPTVKRKRGRPCKVKKYQNNNASVDNICLYEGQMNGNNAISPNKTSTTPKITIIETSHSKHDDLRSDIKPTPKRRGRPPKVKIEQTKGDGTMNTPKRRGRPPKVKPDQNNSTSFIDDCLPKVSIMESDANTSIITESKSNTLKNDKDGERSINPASAGLNTVNENYLGLSKRRGRPPKRRFSGDAIVEEEKNNLVVSPTYQTPKRRGRPPLNKGKGAVKRGRPPRDARQSALVKGKMDVVKRKTEDYSLGDPLFSSELLGTDIIVINKEKLNSVGSSASNKKRQCKRNTVVYDDLSSDEDLEKRLDTSKQVSLQSRRIIISSDESNDDDYDNDDDNSDYESSIKKKGRSTSKTINRTGRKRIPPSIKCPLENSFFRIKHDLNDKVVCGVCKESMDYERYRDNHAVTKHYMLCWLDGEEPPLDMSDPKEVVNRLWIAKKRLGKTPFRCPICNIPKLSAVGFQSHIRFCGKEQSEKISLLVACEICGIKMMPSSLKPHIYIKHKRESENSPTVDTQLILPKRKRAAASRAVEVIQSQKEEDNEQYSRSRPVSPDTNQNLVPFYIKPNRPVSNDLCQKWKTSLKETNFVKCSHPGCDFVTDSTCSIRRHFTLCPFGTPRLYKCRTCTFTSLEEKAMQDHIIEKHENIINDINSSDYESSDGCEDEDSGRIRYSHYATNLPFKFLKSSFLLRRHGSRNRFFFPEAFKWTLKMRQNILSEDMLFSEFENTSSNWSPLTQDVIPQYAPQQHKSVQFKGSGNTWYTLRCFEATLLDGVPMMFAGGPVWATAWAPVPDNETQQFLAVATHPTMERTHEMAAVYNYNSLIQIWKVGFFTNLEHSGETPKFLLGLAHNRGAVWALRWCPSGCYQESRLGLLAASCSDGSVAIYRIPRYRQSFEYTMYKADPVIELKLGCEMLSQCTCIEWSSIAPHNTIVGGFANGMVAIWDLSTTSQLLREGITIYPYRVIEAHLSSVTAVCISENLLMTASLDRSTKYWQLDDSTVPINSLRKASVMDAVMPSLWLTSINAYDDVYSMNSSHVTGYNVRETHSSNNTNLLLQPGTVWSLSFNDWLNACACGSELGKLSVFFRQQLLVAEDSKKVKKGSLIADAMAASVQHLNSSSNTESFGPKYNECVSKIGLQFSFKSQFNDSSRTKPGCSSDTMDSYPILSINKVAWNPNLHSFSWMAAGMQCGLVLIPHIRSVAGWGFADLYKNMDRQNT